jgi:hypothetical protein
MHAEKGKARGKAAGGARRSITPDDADQQQGKRVNSTLVPSISLLMLSIPRFSRFQAGRRIQRFAFAAQAGVQTKLARTLYRQLLRWCDNSDPDIPLNTFIPPVTLSPPQVDEQALQKLAAAEVQKDDQVLRLLPTNSKIQPHQITIPIYRASDVRNFFRAIFRLNAAQTTVEIGKERVSWALKGLKSLNELTETLQDMKKQHDKHLDRTGVKFHVGQGEIMGFVLLRWNDLDLDLCLSLTARLQLFNTSAIDGEVSL